MAVEDTYAGDSLEQTCLRIRVHYYGNARDLPQDNFLTDTIKGVVFDNTIPQLLPNNSGAAGYLEPAPGLLPSNPSSLYRSRKLYKNELAKKGYSETYFRLTSHADENGPKLNPSPYLIQNGDEIDFGQILYGFESVLYQPHEPLDALAPPPSNTYSQFYRNFPVQIVNDLAGWIANVATPSSEFFYRQLSGEPLHKPKLSNNLDAYYLYSAPDADLYGNADSIGILRAYQVLLEANPPEYGSEELRLSDILTLYYLGSSQLRPEINPPLENSIHPFYTSDNRWKIFALFFGFMKENDSGAYIWVPGTSDWESVLAQYDPETNPKGRNYNNRLFAFSTFWYNEIITGVHYIILGSFITLDIEYPDSLITRYLDSGEFNNTGDSEKAFVTQQLFDCFHNKFIPFLENKISL